MFRIVLRPDEQAVLRIIEEGLYPTLMVPVSVVFKLVSLRMLACDQHGQPRLTQLGEAALARVTGKIH
jgi:hypothetical protein